MSKLKLGISPCPNDVFIFSGIILNQIDMGNLAFDIEYQDVEALNHMANEGVLDAVKISYANYKNCSSWYNLLSCGGALGPAIFRSRDA